MVRCRYIQEERKREENKRKDKRKKERGEAVGSSMASWVGFSENQSEIEPTHNKKRKKRKTDKKEGTEILASGGNIKRAPTVLPFLFNHFKWLIMAILLFGGEGVAFF